MRKVYHGSTEVITNPLVHIGRDNLDFGKGFYVTDIRKQAKTWADIKSSYLMDAEGVVLYQQVTVVEAAVVVFLVDA